MTQAQIEACTSGISPEETDALFLAQHLSAYAFARRLVAGKRVLEIGFGYGYGSNYLAEVAADVTGIDMAHGNIPRAQATYPRPNLRFLHMEGTRLRFSDGSFDVVGSFQVIEHIPEAQLGDHLSEVRRVLRPEGVYCLSTLNLAHNIKPGRPYQKMHMHEKEFTGPELRALLERFFPQVDLYGLYLTPKHRLYLRLKRWGLNRLGPPRLNPIARFYTDASVADFVARPGASRDALDLIAVCWNSSHVTEGPRACP